MNSPGVLVLDEPTLGLDPQTRARGIQMYLQQNSGILDQVYSLHRSDGGSMHIGVDAGRIDEPGLQGDTSGDRSYLGVILLELFQLFTRSGPLRDRKDPQKPLFPDARVLSFSRSGVEYRLRKAVEIASQKCPAGNYRLFLWRFVDGESSITRLVVMAND